MTSVCRHTTKRIAELRLQILKEEGIVKNLKTELSWLLDEDRELTNIENGYWVGPFGIRVPLSIDNVKDYDDCNNIFQDGGTTEMRPYNPPLTRNQYLEKYAVLKDGHYWWNEEKKL
jgi:hypothetical protein